jgi:hypothetical protein
MRGDYRFLRSIVVEVAMKNFLETVRLLGLTIVTVVPLYVMYTARMLATASVPGFFILVGVLCVYGVVFALAFVRGLQLYGALRAAMKERFPNFTFDQISDALAYNGKLSLTKALSFAEWAESFTFGSVVPAVTATLLCTFGTQVGAGGVTIALLFPIFASILGLATWALTGIPIAHLRAQWAKRYVRNRFDDQGRFLRSGEVVDI